MKLKVPGIVGSRELYTLGTRKQKVTITIGRPMKVKSGDDWACPYHIGSLGMREIRYSYGIDAPQALLLAFQHIRAYLEKSGKRFSWLDGEEGDIGFPRFVPDSFGRGFSRRLDSMIDREIEQFARRAENRYRRRKGSKGAGRRKYLG